MKQAYQYNKLVWYYNRSRRKLQRLTIQGKNLRRQDILQRRIARLFKMLLRFRRTLKIGMATATLSTCMLLFQPGVAQAQIISFGDSGNNPFSMMGGIIDVGNYSAPGLADLDADGDMDMVVGRHNAFEDFGDFSVLNNIGTAIKPSFSSISVPGLGYINGLSPWGCTPVFADLDADGDLDLLTEGTNGLLYLQNTGTPVSPFFTTPLINPFGLTAGAQPAFADLDSDGDMDVITIAGDSFRFSENIGTPNSPSFAAPIINSFGLTNASWYTTPAFADLDGDGDLDLLTGTYTGDFTYYQNIGSASIPFFTAPQTNPFDLSEIANKNAPSLADLDTDGDMDLMVGTYEGQVSYYQNTGTFSTPHFHAEGIQINPFGLAPAGLYSLFEFADLDGDADQDIFTIAWYNEDWSYYQNIGTSLSPKFDYSANPTELSDIGVFVDLDGDGDLDMLNSSFGNVEYYQNAGTANLPAFIAPITNPFGLTGSIYGPTFADLDGDGDLDFLRANFEYYQNTGSVNIPEFATPQNNPFGLVSINWLNDQSFTDLDKDGDFDLIARDFGGSFFYFENAGTATAPAFNAPLSNPFGLVDVCTEGYDFAIADLDGDGDNDLLAEGYRYFNEYSSCFYYFENTTTCYGKTVFADSDGDSFGDAANNLFVEDCIVAEGYAENNTDCNDATAAIYPGATEIANGIDDDCNGIIDDGVCNVPAGITTTNITSTSAELNWDAVAIAMGYKIVYEVANGKGPAKTTFEKSTSKEISNLKPNTLYFWQVKSVCSTDPKVASGWSTKQFFTTSTLRMGDEQTTTLELYPNPTAENFTLDLRLQSATDQSATIYLLNTLGQIVYSSHEFVNGELKKEITMPSTASAGCYVVRVVMSDDVMEKKLMYHK